jgi:mannose-6-phosphate isomerase-like protein (cupin superfamily)
MNKLKSIKTFKFLFICHNTFSLKCKLNLYKNSKFLVTGDVVTIPRGMPHQLEAVDDGEIFEISTQHFDTDSYRIEKGN